MLGSVLGAEKELLSNTAHSARREQPVQGTFQGAGRGRGGGGGGGGGFWAFPMVLEPGWADAATAVPQDCPCLLYAWVQASRAVICNAAHWTGTGKVWMQLAAEHHGTVFRHFKGLKHNCQLYRRERQETMRNKFQQCFSLQGTRGGKEKQLDTALKLQNIFLRKEMIGKALQLPCCPVGACQHGREVGADWRRPPGQRFLQAP